MPNIALRLTFERGSRRGDDETLGDSRTPQTASSPGASDQQMTANDVKPTGSIYTHGRASDGRAFAVRHLAHPCRSCTILSIGSALEIFTCSTKVEPTDSDPLSVPRIFDWLCEKGAAVRDQRVISWCTRSS